MASGKFTLRWAFGMSILQLGKCFHPLGCFYPLENLADLNCGFSALCNSSRPHAVTIHSA
jgi:hypothetical protein